MRVTRREIADLVCVEYQFGIRDLLDEKARASPEARRVAALLMHEMMFSSGQIAKALERDGSTIRYALEKIRKDIEKNPELAARVAKLLDLLKAKAAAGYDTRIVRIPGQSTHIDDIRKFALARQAEADRRAQLREWIKKLRRRGFSENGLVRWSGLPREEVKAIIDGVVMS